MLETRAYYVPNAKVRLLSPQRYLRTANKGALLQTPGSTTFYFDRKSPLTFHALNEDRVGLPVASLHRRRKATWFDEALLNADVLNSDNSNLSLPQKELLGWHYKLGHYNLAWVQRLARPRPGDDTPLLPMRFPSTANTPPTAIKCHSCRLGKATRAPDGAHVEKVRPEKDGTLKKEALRFGSKSQQISLLAV